MPGAVILHSNQKAERIRRRKNGRAPPQPHPRVYELDGLKLLDLEDATVEIAVRIGLNYGEPEAPIRDSEVSVYYLSNLNNSEPLRLGIAPR